MNDYTPEGVHHYQTEIAASYLPLIDKKLGKISRNIGYITIAVIATLICRNKTAIKQQINKMKGE